MMSQMFQKSIASIPSLIIGSFNGYNDTLKSEGLVQFASNYSILKSKQTEKLLISKEISMIKQVLSQPDVSLMKKRDFLIRLMYCHLIGYDVSFAYIHAILLAQQGDLHMKRAGYFFCSLFFNEHHEMSLLLFNTLIKDLQSTNVVCEYTALIACTHLINNDMIRTILPHVFNKLKHPKDIVRKKSIICLHSFLQRQDSELYATIMPYTLQMLNDKDLGVIWATVEIYLEFVSFYEKIKMDVKKRMPDLSVYLKKTTPILLNLLEKLMTRKFPSLHDYHTIPSPWFSISIIKLLSKYISFENNSNCSIIKDALVESLKKIKTDHRAGLAVLYEILLALSSFRQLDSETKSQSVRCISRFMNAKHSNYKYLGIKLLTIFLEMDTTMALQHQSTILDCLQHEDKVIQQQTLSLLCKIVNVSNKEIIFTKLIDFVLNSISLDSSIQIMLCKDLTDIIYRFFKSEPDWCVKKLFFLIQSVPALLPELFLNQIQKHLLINNKNVELQNMTFNLALDFLKTDIISDSNNLSLIELCVWVINEFMELQNLSNLLLEEILSHLNRLFKKCNNLASRLKNNLIENEEDPSVFFFLNNDIDFIALCSNTTFNESLEKNKEINYKSSNHSELSINNINNTNLLFIQNLIILIFMKMIPNVSLLTIENFITSNIKLENKSLIESIQELHILALNSSLVENIKLDIKKDFTLSFLDNYVVESLENGAFPYMPIIKNTQFTPLSSSIQLAKNNNSLKANDLKAEGPLSLNLSYYELKNRMRFSVFEKEESSLETMPNIWTEMGLQGLEQNNYSINKEINNEKMKIKPEDDHLDEDRKVLAKELFQGIFAPEV